MDGLMIAAGFPVFTDRFNQVLNYSSPVRERFPNPIAHQSAFDPDILYGRRRENDTVFTEDAAQFLQDIPRRLTRDPGRLQFVEEILQLTPGNSVRMNIFWASEKGLTLRRNSRIIALLVIHHAGGCS